MLLFTHGANCGAKKQEQASSTRGSNRKHKAQKLYTDADVAQRFGVAAVSYPNLYVTPTLFVAWKNDTPKP